MRNRGGAPAEDRRPSPGFQLRDRAALSGNPIRS